MVTAEVRRRTDAVWRLDLQAKQLARHLRRQGAGSPEARGIFHRPAEWHTAIRLSAALRSGGARNGTNG